MIRAYIKSFFDPKHIQALANFKKYITKGFSKKTYSDNGEDIFLFNKIFSTKTSGFYVDVGAFHPFLSSNTFLLYKKGWKGINIDPNEASIRAFKRFRPRDINVCMGVGMKKERRSYYRFSHAGVNTFSPDAATEKQGHSWNAFLGKTDVDVMPLKEIFKEYLPKGQTIDLLDIDVEGLDYEVLLSNDWSAYKPGVVVIEDKTFIAADPTASDIYTFLTARGYTLRAFLGNTLLFSQLA